MAERPTGITILAILNILFGLVVGYGAIGTLIIFSAFTNAPLELNILTIMLIITFIVGFFFIIEGFGYWRMAGWAWPFAIFTFLLNLIPTVLIPILDSNPETDIILTPLVIKTIIIIYVYTMKDQFGKRVI